MRVTSSSDGHQDSDTATSRSDLGAAPESVVGQEADDRLRSSAHSRWSRTIQRQPEPPRYQVVSPASARPVTVRDEGTDEDREMVMFAASNPLRLATHPYVVERVLAAVTDCGIAAPANRSSSFLWRREGLAGFVGTGGAVLYATGYHTTVGLLSGLVGHRDVACWTRWGARRGQLIEDGAETVHLDGGGVATAQTPVTRCRHPSSRQPFVAMFSWTSQSAGLASSVVLARQVQARLNASYPLPSGDLFALAAEAFGGTLAEGAFSPRDAYDAAELGLHLCLLRGAGTLPADPDAFYATLAEVERLAALLPTQTRRTAEQNDFQQFSTPAPYAALCAWVAGVRPGDRVLEPSAGTGALCAFALAAGASVYANELSERRADLLSVLLREAGQDPAETLTRENADHLDAVLPAHVRARVVVMNPPFSQTAGRLGRRRVATVGTDHVLQALRRLDAGGRLVAILSASVQRSKPAYRSFSETVDTDPFRLRADIEVGGSVYRPNGTSVRTRLLVVDRTSDHGNQECVTAVAETIRDAVAMLTPVATRSRVSI